MPADTQRPQKFTPRVLDWLASQVWRILSTHQSRQPDTMSGGAAAGPLIGGGADGLCISDLGKKDLTNIPQEIKVKFDAAHGSYAWRRASRPIYCLVTTCLARFLQRAMFQRNARLWEHATFLDVPSGTPRTRSSKPDSHLSKRSKPVHQVRLRRVPPSGSAAQIRVLS